jgi:uncharacterized membrane protein YdbT with pleckstrin-like domain
LIFSAAFSRRREISITLDQGEAMAFQIHPDEKVHRVGEMHWSIYIGPLIWLLFCCLLVIGQLILDLKLPLLILACAVVAVAPLALTWLRRMGAEYVITTQRFYSEEGILAKSIKDVPLAKVNDILLTQTLVQRIFGSGDLTEMTGNDTRIQISNIEEAEKFKDALSAACASKAS